MITRNHYECGSKQILLQLPQLQPGLKVNFAAQKTPPHLPEQLSNCKKPLCVQG